jgi:hypothetical protein
MQAFMRKTLTNHMRERIEQMGFRGILKVAAKSLDDRDFISWLMDCFNMKNMQIEIGEGKLLLIDESTKHILGEVASSLFPDKTKSKSVKINPNKAAE